MINDLVSCMTLFNFIEFKKKCIINIFIMNSLIKMTDS